MKSSTPMSMIATMRVAFFGEMEYEMDGLSFCLSSQVRIAGKEK